MIEERKSMMAFQLPDPATPFGERVARRLRDDLILWLTTIDSKDTPQPNPVWFFWDATTSTILVYSKAGAKRHEHLQKHSRVSLNFDGNGTGGNIIVLTGEARLSSDDPPANQHPLFVAKYQDFITRSFSTAENFSTQYPVALRISLTNLRGF
jgi:PPOX class probable F420-dependent enzyme